MKYLFVVLSLFFTITAAKAAGEPLNQDFTDLIKIASQAIDLGKQGKKDEFMTALDGALDKVKDQKQNGDSPKLQRVGAKLKSAKKLGKEGKVSEAVEMTEEALSVVK